MYPFYEKDQERQPGQIRYSFEQRELYEMRTDTLSGPVIEYPKAERGELEKESRKEADDRGKHIPGVEKMIEDPEYSEIYTDIPYADDHIATEKRTIRKETLSRINEAVE